MELYVAVVSGFLAALIVWWRSLSNVKLPPGPWGLPIVGYLPFLTSKPYLKLTELAKQYGNVFSIRLGSRNVIILNDFESTKDVFTKDAFIGRPPEIFQLNKETIETGAFFGLPWKEQRRHVLHLLRDLGYGKTKMEDQIQEEITDLMDNFEKSEGKPYRLTPLLSPSTSNNIATFVFGKRLKYDDPLRQKLTKIVAEGNAAAGQLEWLIFFPWLKNFLQLLGFKPDRFSRANMALREFVEKEIDEHIETFNPDNIRDFIDGYIMEMQKRKNDPTFARYVLEDLVGALFAAGSETVRQSVEWLVLTAATFQKAQLRIQDEIQDVIGISRPPIWPDIHKMPYTNAFMNEVMRWITLVPINLLRYTLTDTELNGFFIPKHTLVISNHWAIHHDPDYWGTDADEFRPERFLSEDGKEVLKKDRFVPFSLGKRSCPGEPLAKVEIFLYFVSILQRFHVKLPDGKGADFEPTFGIALDPKPQDVILTKRS